MVNARIGGMRRNRSVRFIEHPSIGMAIRWQMNTVNPMAKGARTCAGRQQQHHRLQLAFWGNKQLPRARALPNRRNDTSSVVSLLFQQHCKPECCMRAERSCTHRQVGSERAALCVGGGEDHEHENLHATRRSYTFTPFRNRSVPPQC